MRWTQIFQQRQSILSTEIDKFHLFNSSGEIYAWKRVANTHVQGLVLWSKHSHYQAINRFNCKVNHSNMRVNNVLFYMYVRIKRQNVLQLNSNSFNIVPLHSGLTQRLAPFKYMNKFRGSSDELYGTFLTFITRPASSSNEGGSYIMSWTNLTTSGLFRKLSSTKFFKSMIWGGRVASLFPWRLSDSSFCKATSDGGRLSKALSHKFNDRKSCINPTSAGTVDRQLPPRYKTCKL